MDIFKYVIPGTTGLTVADYIVKIMVTILATYTAIYLVKIVLHQWFSRTNFTDEKRQQTVESIVSNASKYLAFFIIVISIVEPFIDLKKIMVAGGVLGVVIGFGAQSLMKDLFTGWFLLFEKQFQKGDFVHINGDADGGTVEEVGLRVLKLRMLTGKLMIVPNGEIKKVVNGNMATRRVSESVVVSFREDPSRMKSLLEKVCETLNEEHTEHLRKENDEFIEPYRVQGLSSLDSTHTGYRFTIVATVIDTEYVSASMKVKELLAQTLYDHHVKMPEQQVFYQTRATTK